MIIIILKLIVLSALSPFYVGVVRKVKAKMQNRQGASVLQPYYDLIKLFHKDEIIPKDASWIFRVSPVIIFGISLLLPLGIPLLSTSESLPYFGDFIVIIYLLATMTFFLALAGMDTGSFFGGFGSSREMTINALTEGGLLFSFVPLALVSNSSSFVTMAISVEHLPIAVYIPILISFCGFFIAIMSETGRIPFDNAATHLELTMMHEAMVLEYSGKRLALIEWASANKLLFFTLIGVNVFFPWAITAEHSLIGFILNVLFIAVKTVVLVSIIAVIEMSIAKFRLFRLPDLLMTGFIFSVIAILITSL